MTIGLIFIFGLLIALCNKAFYRNFGGFGHTVCVATGFIGTPLHELAHALFCVVFGHKIVEIKLFQISSSDGTLGYVNHSYNPRNIYHRIGNFFIGVAPIIVISVVLYFLCRWITPTMALDVAEASSQIAFTGNIGEVLKSLFMPLIAMFKHALTGEFWLFMLVGILFSLHMTLSPADVKGALSGLISLVLLLLIVDGILVLVSQSLFLGFTEAITSFGSFMLGIYVLSLAMSVFAVLVSFIIRKIFRR